MKDISLVSVIITTRNSASTLRNCLESLKKQRHSALEIIVVDRNSQDSTKDIARAYTDSVFNKEPERCAQRNYGLEKANGSYVFFIDSDMELSPGVVEEAVETLGDHPEAGGVIIPEESFGVGFWSQCKKLERSFYVGIDWMEAARFFKREDIVAIGGYDESLVSGEDWDLSQRAAKKGPLLRISSFIYHNEGKISLLKTISKKYYYAGKITGYTGKREHAEAQAKQTSVLSRYKLFLSDPFKLFRHPLLGAGMLFMKTCEFGFGGAGIIASYVRRKQDKNRQ